ncbi:sensor histidine kinase [Clostridium sp. Marseille-P3244]|uniref:sensor histidine kinase n=1 Tax=Clostridium sp. Marseille-P3244 TaxID=1871020 RepID=UPI000930021A|nr:HAMP domain-containing sensor histidine kinase [Clostridium sp. Marseille-P3244]
MKYSVRKQMTVVFIGLFVFILGAVLIINTGFLGSYYLSHKSKDLIRTYNEIDRLIQEDGLTDEEAMEGILLRTERSNTDLVVVNTSGNAILSTLSRDDPRFKEMMIRGLLGLSVISPEKVISENDNYTIYWTDNQGDSGNVEYLKMWGRFSDGSWFVMQSPLASIRESASLANRFLIYLGGLGIILGGVLVWLFSRRFTRPVMELARLSQEMANLNFDAKYKGRGCDEIGILGSNFNRMSAQLEKTISELKSANNELQKDIEQKEKVEKMRNEFLGNVSHELKTPIALIQGYAEGLKEGINDDPESREFYCDVIMDEAGKMNQMVKNLLTLNQLEFGSDEVQFERFDIVRLVRGVIASCDILVQQVEAEVDLISDECVYVWADEFKTEQVVRNYLTNAIHHVENEKRIEVRIIKKEDTVRVSVFNSGKPIPEEDIPRLWDKFYKVDKAHTREYGGNGIGLSIVKAIMESFRQKYGVENFDNGVSFWFELDAKTDNILGAAEGQA